MTEATPLRVIVVGCTPLARHVLALVEDVPAAQLVGVVNLSAAAAARKANFEPLAAFRRRRPHDLHLTADINAAATVAWIAGRQPDLVIQCGWSQIFRAAALATPRLFCIGIHPAPLPLGRGAAVINWQLIEGGGAWGNSLFVMEPGIDVGDVLDFEPFDLEPRDDVRTAYQKVDRTALRMLRRTLPRIAAGAYVRRPQNDRDATRYRRRVPDDGQIDVWWSARRIGDFVRALTHPYPGAFIETSVGRVSVWRVTAGPSATGDSETTAPGTVLAIRHGRGVLLRCGADESVWLERVTAPHDIEQWADEWAQEAGLAPGTPLVAGRRPGHENCAKPIVART